MNNKKKNLRETSIAFEENIQKMKMAHDIIQEDSKNLDSIDRTYEEVGDQATFGQKQIKELKAREYREKLYIYIGLGFYIACCVYILLRRFPIHKLIEYAMYFIYKIISLIYTIIEYTINAFSSDQNVNATNSSNESIALNILHQMQMNLELDPNMNKTEL